MCTYDAVGEQARCQFCGNPLADNPADNEAKPKRTVRRGEVDEIPLATLAASDYLLIETANSLYKFTVIEPTCWYGVLSGGRLGNYRVAAWLLGALRDGDTTTILHIGASAVFQVDSLALGRRLETSPIRRLIHVSGGSPTRACPSVAAERVLPSRPLSLTDDSLPAI